MCSISRNSSLVTDPGVCAVCSRDASAGTILICDNCDDEYHMGCLDPPVFSVPEGDWFCPKCDPDAYAALRKRSMIEHSVSSTEYREESQAKKTKKRTGRPRSKSIPQQSASDGDNSEDACMVCGLEGKLLVCEFAGCTKVFHKNCVWPSSMGAENLPRWVCPRHHCVVCQVEETEKKRSECSSSSTTTMKLVQCNRCTISFCERHVSAKCCHRVGSSFRCSQCLKPSARLELAVIFQEAWSKMANHYLSLPFMRPFLSVLADGPNLDGKARDLLDILERIRCLRYDSSNAFSEDLDSLYDRCQKLVPGNDTSISQAYSTLLLSARQVLNKYATKLKGLESLVLSTDQPCAVRSSDIMYVAGMEVGLHGHRVGARLPDITPCRSISEWQQYVINPPLQVHNLDSLYIHMPATLF